MVIKKTEIEYKLLEDKTLIVFNVPDMDQKIEVRLRPLTRRDRGFIKTIDDDDEYGPEKILSHVITKWGDRDSIGILELMQPERDLPCEILQEVYAKVYKRNFRLSQRE